MEKQAPVKFEIHPLLVKRFSPRAFSLKEVEDEKINKMIEAARWAPSSSNDQPWRFIIGKKGKGENYDKIFNSLVEFNQIWCKNVPVLIALVGNKISDKRGKLSDIYPYDVGQAAAFMTFQATEDGLFCHQMGGFEKEEIVKAFDIPEQFEPLALMAVGYQGELDVLPENFQRMEKEDRQRKDFDDIIFTGEWK